MVGRVHRGAVLLAAEVGAVMRSEALAEVLYRAWVASDHEPNMTSLRRLPFWLELDRHERDRWREVAEAALTSTQRVEDWHGKAKTP